MHSIALAIVQEGELREALREVGRYFVAPIEFLESLTDIPRLDKRKNVGILILDYTRYNQMSPQERDYFYRLNIPRIIITERDGQYFMLPIPGITRISDTSRFFTEKILHRLQEYFRPVPVETVDMDKEKPVFLTRNRKMQEILNNARRIGKYNTQVFILGESGTGKDVLAHIIHLHSKRRELPMIKVNCAAIPENLLETELFGYKKGAFTNAYEDKIGKIQMANGSTLFLDEVGELAPNLQAKLLRVVEMGEVDMIGSAEPVRVDVRFISATNRDIRREIEQGNFRSDLYYRLNVVNFHLLPLRDRPEDVSLLFAYFVDQFKAKYHKTIENISSEVNRLLLEYPWPGNVRELKHFAERLVLKITDSRLDPEVVRQEIQDMAQLSRELPTLKLTEYLEHQEKQYILKILIKNDFRVLQTAQELGVSRVSLFRKMRKYGIDVRQLKQNKS